MSVTAADLLVRIGADVSGATAGIASVNSKIGLLAKGGLVAGAGLAVGLGVAVGASVKAAGNFEQALNVFQAVSNATGTAMEGVRSKALALGNDMTLPGTSARDAAEAMTELAKGGLTASQAMDAAKGTLQLAAAAGIENAEAATITARALNAFGLAAGQAGKVSDLLAAGANASTAEIGDLASGMQMAASSFKQGRQPIDTLVTGLGLMANAGIAGSDAGTSLKTMMMRLQAPTDDAAGALEKMGVNVRNSKGQMLPMRNIIGQFTTATKGMTDAQRDAAFSTIFGTDAIRAANIILAGGTTAWDKMNGAVNKSGAAQDMSAAKMKGFNGAMEAFKSSLETLAIVFGTMLLPAFTSFFTALANGTVWLSNLVSSLQGGGAAADEMKGRLAPLQQVFAALAAVVAYFRAKYQEVAAAIRAHSAEIKATVESLRQIFRAVWPQISAIVKAAWDTMKAVIDSSLKVIGNLIRAVMAILRGDWQTAWIALKDAAVAAIRGAGQLVMGTLKLLVTQVIPLALKIGRAIVTSLLNGLVTLASMLLTKLWNAIKSAASSAASRAATEAATIGRAIVDGIVSGLTGLAGQLASKLLGPLEGAYNKAKGFLGINSPSRLFMQLGSGIGEGILLGYLQSTADLPDKVSAPLRATLERAKATVDAQKASMLSAFDRLAADSVSAFDARTSQMGAKLDARLDALLGKIERGRAKLTASERQLAEMDRAGRQEQLTTGLSDANAQLDKANGEGDPEAIARAQRAVRDAELAITRDGLEQKAALERAAADKKAAREQEAATKRFEKLKLDMTSEREQGKRHLEDRLASVRGQIEKEPLEWAKGHKKLMKLWSVFGKDYAESGSNLGAGFAQGIKSQQKAVAAAAAALAATAASYLKTNSPSEKGPMSDLNTWWAGLAPALLAGLDGRQLERGLSAMVPGGVGAPSLAGAGAGSAFGGGGEQTIVLNIDLGTETITKVVRLGLRDVRRRNLTDQL